MQHVMQGWQGVRRSPLSDPPTKIGRMPPTPPPDGSPRSADAVNADIRALWTHPDARLTDEQREKYRQLLTELRQVERRDVTTAA